jgi:hypothetical protein
MLFRNSSHKTPAILLFPDISLDQVKNERRTNEREKSEDKLEDDDLDEVLELTLEVKPLRGG